MIISILRSKKGFGLLAFCILLAQQLNAQQTELPPATLKPGDPAPPIKFGEWFKGSPVTSLEKGKIYVIEFWATWCAPCRAAMPRLSKLTRKLGRKVTVIGVDVMESKSSTSAKVRSFVDSMGRKMRYRVASDDNDYMKINWGDASGRLGMPSAYIVDGNGKLAWFGHPMYLHDVLPKILGNEWDIQKDLNKRMADDRLRALDDSLAFTVYQFGTSNTPYDNFGKPDSALLAIEAIVRNEPGLKYAPRLGNATFCALLRTNPHEAYEFGKKMVETPTYDPIGFESLIYSIGAEINHPFIKPEIYFLGAQAYQKYIDWIPYPELHNLPVYYGKIAEWYDRAGNKQRSISAHRKAIKSIRRKKT